MKLLLDTHCWLWWISDSGRLSEYVRQLIAKADNQVFFSAASSWEIAIKYSLGKLELPESPEYFIPERLARDSFFKLAVEHIHALHVANIPYHHRDPFDRLIISQSQMENIPVVTADVRFKDYDVQIIWANN